jgi:hypothetical protein
LSRILLNKFGDEESQIQSNFD